MTNAPFSAWTTGQIPKWSAPVGGDPSAYPHSNSGAGEWEASYLLPQLVGAAEHPTHAGCLKRLTRAAHQLFPSAKRSNRHVHP